jgi:hypothetical protein
MFSQEDCLKAGDIEEQGTMSQGKAGGFLVPPDIEVPAY